MKKLFLFLVMLIGAVGANAAATNTPTLTDTPTNTFTVTPTFTPTPDAIYNSNYVRNYIQPGDMYADDGITKIGPTVVTGPSPYLTQYLSQTAATLGTNSAKVRINWTVPANFGRFNSRGQGYLRAYIVAVHSVTNTAVPVVVDITRMGFNKTTGTSTTVYSGTYQTLTARTSDALRNFTVSRVPLILPASLTQTAIVAGDTLSLTIEKQTSVAIGLLRILRFEWEYEPVDYKRP